MQLVSITFHIVTIHPMNSPYLTRLNNKLVFLGVLVCWPNVKGQNESLWSMSTLTFAEQ